MRKSASITQSGAEDTLLTWIRIYKLVLVQDKPIGVGWYDHLPTDPPLLSTCKQIRAEASSIYSMNNLSLDVYNLDITKLVRWLGSSPPRWALYLNADLILIMIVGHDEKAYYEHDLPWVNLMVWIRLYCQERCGRLADMPVLPKENGWVGLALKAFDMVDELIDDNDNITFAEIYAALEARRRALKF